jgi:hypothetical protein
MSEGSVGAGLKLGDAELSVRLAPVKDFALAIGADDVVTPREYTFLRQKVGELIAIDEGESVDVLTRHAIRLFAPQAKPEALATLGLRLAKLKPSVDAVCADGIVTLQEIDFLKKKIADLQLLKGGETVEQLLRVAFQPMLGRVQFHPVAMAALSGAKAPTVSPVTVVVTSDGFEARAAVEKGQRWTKEDVFRALAEARVVHGIDPRWMDGSPPIPQPGTTIVLARATMPGRGADRTIDWQVPTTRAVSFSAASAREPVTFDADTLQAPFLVEDGQTLAVLSPQDVGDAGMSVRGEEIPGALGDTPPVFAGVGVEVSDDGLSFLATEAGALSVSSSGVVSVHPVYEVPKGVTSTLEIFHRGSVIVHGDVSAGSRIIATGDVRIEGNVDRSQVRAGGVVVVRGGLFQKAFIKAVGDVVVRRCEGESSVEAGGNIFILADAVNSHLDAGPLVSVLGSVSGGSVKAFVSIEADAFVLGRATETQLEVHGQVNPKTATELREHIAQLDEEAARARGALASGLAEASATKVSTARATPDAPRRPAPLVPGRTPIGPATISRLAPAGATDSTPRTPPATAEAFEGDGFAPLTTAAALRMHLREDVAFVAENDASFARSRLALVENPEPSSLLMRVVARSSIASGVRVRIEASRLLVPADKGPGAVMPKDGALAFIARVPIGGL